MTYVRYVFGRDIKAGCFFCKPTDTRAITMEVFNTINNFLEKNEASWESCTGLGTDGAQTISG
jgi:hypothetical protein